MSQRVRQLLLDERLRRAQRKPHRAPVPAPGATLPLPRWTDSTVVILGSGCSLTPDDVNLCRGRARVIAINDTHKLAPWADALYACDYKWWHWYRGVPEFTGLKMTLDPRVAGPFPEIRVFRNTGERGLEMRRDCIHTGKNSGHQAINVAWHLGARAILLLGYDMKLGPGGRHHYFGAHPDRQPPPFHHMLPHFAYIAADLTRLGVTVINCTRETALEAFPKMKLADALARYGRPVLTEAVA